MSDGRAEALLRSALEKIVYFEARSETLQADGATLRAEADALRADLAAAAQREVELRHRVAELEVERARAHREREEAARVLEAMRAERAGLMGKVLEAARIQGASAAGLDFDLAGFIADLRAEALAVRTSGSEASVADGPHPREAVEAPRPSVSASPTVSTTSSSETLLETSQVAVPSGGSPVSPARATVLAVTLEAERLFEQGRLAVPPSPRLGEESLFGFSVRELSSPDPDARCRAAERLRSLGDRAAAPAIAVALHAERDDRVLVALLDTFRALASREGAAVVEPLLGASEPAVRIAALRAITHLDPDSAPSHLSRAAHDPEASVRRRTALIAVSLGPERMLELEREVARDPDPEVRRLAVLAAGAAGGDQARGRLLGALEDPDLGVRRAAARSLSGLLGVEVGHVPALSDEERRREVRRLAMLEPPPLSVRARGWSSVPAVRTPDRELQRAPGPPAPTASPLPDLAPLEVPEPAPIEVALAPAGRAHGAPLHADEALCLQIASELRGAMRGRTVMDLAAQLGVTDERVIEAAALLTARGQVVRRGAKLFVA